MSNKKHPEYQYLDLLKEILESGIENIDRGTGAKTYSVFGRQIKFDLSMGFPLLTTKKVYWKGVLHELYWFLSGQTNIKYLVDNNVHIWDDYPLKYYNRAVKEGKEPELSKEEFVNKIREDEKFAAAYGELRRIYGEQWRRWPTKSGKTIDQVQWIVDEIKDDPDCRNTIVNSWNPEFLYSMASPEDASLFPICHNMFQVSMKQGKISLQLYQRSADMFLGVPFNIASYALLTHILAQVTGYEVGEYIHTFGDAHIYENHVDQVKEQLTRKPLPFPSLTIDERVKTIDDFKPEHAYLNDYASHDPLRASMAVAGGLFEKDDTF